MHSMVVFLTLILAVSSLSIFLVEAEPIKLHVETCPPADPYGYVSWTWEEKQGEMTVVLGSAIKVSPPTLYLPVGYKEYISVRANEGATWSIYAKDSALSVQKTDDSVLVEAKNVGTHWVVFEVNGKELLYPVVVLSSGGIQVSGPHAKIEYNPTIQREVLKIGIPTNGETYIILKNNFPFEVKLENIGESMDVVVEGPKTIPPYGEVKLKITGSLMGGTCCDYIKFKGENWCNSLEWYPIEYERIKEESSSSTVSQSTTPIRSSTITTTVVSSTTERKTITVTQAPKTRTVTHVTTIIQRESGDWLLPSAIIAAAIIVAAMIVVYSRSGRGFSPR